MTDRPAPSIAACTPTIAALLGADPPALSAVQPLKSVIEAARGTCGTQPLQRCLIYAPDAVGASWWTSPP